MTWFFPVQRGREWGWVMFPTPRRLRPLLALAAMMLLLVGWFVAEFATMLWMVRPLLVGRA